MGHSRGCTARNLPCSVPRGFSSLSSAREVARLDFPIRGQECNGEERQSAERGEPAFSFVREGKARGKDAVRVWASSDIGC